LPLKSKNLNKKSPAGERDWDINNSGNTYGGYASKEHDDDNDGHDKNTAQRPVLLTPARPRFQR